MNEAKKIIELAAKEWATASINIPTIAGQECLYTPSQVAGAISKRQAGLYMFERGYKTALAERAREVLTPAHSGE